MRKKTLIMAIIGLSTIASMGVVLANDNTEISPQLEPNMIILTEGNNTPDSVEMNTKTIEVTGGTCSCGKHNYIEKIDNNFKNECPFCKGSLTLHNGTYKNTNVPELELSCTRCGADFCTADGNDKSGTNRKQLTKM